MKFFRFYLILLTLVILGLEMTFAQYTITSSDVLQLNTRVDESHDTTNPVLNLGFPSVGNQWDFSGVSANETVHNHARDPKGLPGSGHFPDATSAFSEDEDSTFIFFQKTSSALSILGITALQPGGDTIINKLNMDIITFPSTILTKFTDFTEPVRSTFPLGFDPDSTGPHPFVDSLGVISRSEINSNFDASGMLKTQFSEFEALRQYIVTTATDSIFMYVNGKWQVISPLIVLISGIDSVQQTISHDYRFWGKDYGFPVANVSFDPGTNTIFDFSWMTSYSVGISDYNAQKFNVDLFPNPVNEVLHIQTDVEDLSFLITDISGKTISRSRLNQNQISVSELVPGSYQISFYSDGLYLGSKQFQVER